MLGIKKSAVFERAGEPAEPDYEARRQPTPAHLNTLILSKLV